MLVLVRHGESALNAEGRLVGRMDPELTELGRTQAAAAGAMLGSVSEVRHSPLTRTTVTANLLGCDAPLLVEERAIEVDYGEFDGKRLEDVAPQYWRLWREDPHFAPPGGESLAELSVRVQHLLDELFSEKGQGARDPDADVVVVSHVSPIKAAVAWALGADELLSWRLRLSTGSVTRISMGPAGPQLVSFNEVPSGS